MDALSDAGELELPGGNFRLPDQRLLQRLYNRTVCVGGTVRLRRGELLLRRRHIDGWILLLSSSASNSAAPDAVWLGLPRGNFVLL